LKWVDGGRKSKNILRFENLKDKKYNEAL